VPALNEGRERVPQRRSRDAELLREVSFGGKAGVRGQEAQADRGSKTLDGFLERRRRSDRPEDRLQRGVALHRATVAEQGPLGNGLSGYAASK
jgi:hypothetical protein